MKKDEMEKFFTRQVAQEGKKVPLSYPDGSESPHWIILRGMDSDAYREAYAEERRLILDLREGDKEIDDKTIDGSQDRILSKLVAAWSFEQECNPENVLNLLKEAPQIREKLNMLTGDRKYFFGQKEKSSAK